RGLVAGDEPRREVGQPRGLGLEVMAFTHVSVIGDHSRTGEQNPAWRWSGRIEALRCAGAFSVVNAPVRKWQEMTGAAGRKPGMWGYRGARPGHEATKRATKATLPGAAAAVTESGHGFA